MGIRSHGHRHTKPVLLHEVVKDRDKAQGAAKSILVHAGEARVHEPNDNQLPKEEPLWYVAVG